MNVMMELRKCCNHPFLIKGVEQSNAAGPKSQDVIQRAITASGKLILIDKMLPRLRREGHKVLIFSQMVRVLDILEDFLRYRQYNYERIDGGVRGNDRQAAIDRFSKPGLPPWRFLSGVCTARSLSRGLLSGSDRFVFLLCTKAGGQGINLTAADTVIIYDSDWNPQNDIQAMARAHRIGQTMDVKIYRLLTRNTYTPFFDHRML
jgi:SNF2 family DNA or RNA helicase